MFRSSKFISLFRISIIVFLGLGSYTAYYVVNRPKLKYVNPRIGPVIEAVFGLGTVIAPRTYQAKTAVHQKLLEVFVQEGQSVIKGQPLLALDESGRLLAPFSGTISSLPFKSGELIFPGVPILTLVELKNLFLEVSLEQQAVLRIKRDQKSTISFESIRDQKFFGQVTAVFPRENQFIVHISVADFPESILPGMTADVAIETGRKENSLLIPLKAIFDGRVVVRRDDKNSKEQVSIGVVDGEWAEVTSKNLNPEDEVLLRNP